MTTDIPAAVGATRRRGRARWRLSSRRVDVSIRWRLTVWYTVVLALTLTVFSLAVYWWLGRSLMWDIDALSRERAVQVEDRMVRSLREQQATMLGLLDPAQYLQLRARGVLVDSIDPFSTPGVGVRVWNQRGNVIDASEELFDTPRLMDFQPIARALQGTVHRYILHTEEGTFYSYSYPTLFSSGRPMFVIQILTSLQAYDRAMDRLARLLVGGTLLVTAIALVTGAALAQTALSSIDTITRTAEQINRAQDLGRRVPAKGPHDEIRRLTDTINEMLDRIEAMFARQRQFMADVSHELRTPLTTIRGEIDLMARTGRLDQEGMEAIRDESERMSRLVGDLLLLARADHELDIARVPVDLDGLMVDVYRQAQRLAGRERVVSLDHVDACRVSGDRDRLRQLVLNLVSNAVMHTPAGTRVSLALVRDEPVARITVADNGPGIPPEALDHLFERFYRLDKARSRRNGGTGLGLAIVDWIATAHGGSVAVDSTLGQGSKFTVRLPLLAQPSSPVSAEDDLDDADEPAHRPPAAAVPSPDDQPEMNEAI